VRTILAMHFVTRDIYYRHNRVWRVGRAVTEDEVRERLSALPGIFTGRLLGNDIELLEQAREAGWFTFTTLEYRRGRRE